MNILLIFSVVSVSLVTSAMMKHTETENIFNHLFYFKTSINNSKKCNRLSYHSLNIVMNLFKKLLHLMIILIIFEHFNGLYSFRAFTQSHCSGLESLQQLL